MMTPTDQHALYHCYAVTLGEMVGGGAGVDELERAIDALPISGEEQSALWLWMIAHRDRRLHEQHNRLSAAAPVLKGLFPSRPATAPPNSRTLAERLQAAIPWP